MSNSSKDTHTRAELVEKTRELQRRLEEAEQTLQAIRNADVDALVMAGPQGERIFSLTGAEHIYRVIVETMHEAALTVDPDGTILFCNQRFCDLMKTPIQGVIGRQVTTFAARPQQRPLKRLLAHAPAGPMQRRLVLQAADGTAVPVQLSASPLQAGESLSICLVASDLTDLEESANSIRVLREHEQAMQEANERLQAQSEELQAQAEELRAQTEELTATQTTLRASESHLAQAQQIARLGSWSWDIGADRLYWSDEIYRIYGLQPGEFVPRHNDFLRFVHPEDRQRVEKFVQEALGHERYSTEFRIVHKGGEERYVHSEGATTFDEEGHPVKMEGTIEDITERKRAEEAVRRSEALLRAVLDASADPIYLKDRDSHLLLANPATFAVVGKPADVVLGKTDAEFYDDPATGRAIMENDRRIMDSGQMEVVEESVPDPAGTRIYLSTKAPYRDAQGRVIGLVGVAREITDQKRTEEILKVKDSAIASSLNAIAMADLQGRLTYVNPAFLEFWGYEDEHEVLGRPVLDFWEEPQGALEVVQAVQNGKGWVGELVAVRKDGAHRHLYLSASAVRNDEGTPICMMASFMDITERKQAEQERRERMKELVCLYAVSHDLQEDLSLDELCRRAVEHLVAAMQFPGLAVAAIELNGKRFTSENYAAGLSHGLQAAITGEGKILGHLRVYYAQERPFIIPEEQNLVNGVAGALGTWLERKRAEETLRESEDRYRAFFQSSIDAVLITAPDGTIESANAEACRMFGKTEEEIIRGGRDGVLDASDPRLPPALEERARTGRFKGELRLRRQDGTVFPGEISSAFFRDRQGRTKTAMIIRDISERKRAEGAVRESEERLRFALQSARMGMWDWDLSTGRGRVTPENQRIFGLPADVVEPRQEDFSKLIHPEDLPRVQRSFVRAAQTGGHYEEQYRICRSDGAERWVHSEGHSVNLPDGRAHFIGVSYDITARKRAEGALRELAATLESKVAERTAELEQRARQLQKLTLEISETEDRERKRMAEILHDDLQQQLAAAKFHVSVLRSRARYDASLQDTAAQIDHMLKDAIETSRSLSHELSPAVMRHADFEETFRWLADQVQAKHGLVVRVEAQGDVRSESEALQGLLYKAAQEFLFNVVKHARVKEACLRVRRFGRCLYLSVSDRGRGFDPQGLRETAGFGLLNVRERVELLGGRMKIRSAPDQGSTFSLVVPDGQQAEDGRQRTEDAGALREPSLVLRSASAGPRLRVLLADDHEIVRQGLRALLSDEHDVEVVGEAANGREAVDLANRLKPDVIVMDVSMPLIEGDEATRQIKTFLPRTRVVAISMYDQSEKMEAMYRAGAENYVLKTAPSEELLAAIRGQEVTGARR